MTRADEVEGARSRIWDEWREDLFNSSYRPANVDEALEDMRALWEDAAMLARALDDARERSS